MDVKDFFLFNQDSDKVLPLCWFSCALDDKMFPAPGISCLSKEVWFVAGNGVPGPQPGMLALSSPFFSAQS